MIIEKLLHRGKTYFAICNTAQETGRDSATEIVRLDNLGDAIALKLYMEGVSLDAIDMARARRAVEKTGALTGQSKRTRKAS